MQNEAIAQAEHAPMQREMKAEKVLEIIRLLEGEGVELWLDGGWGVDALLGEQTRMHGDMDIALPHKDVPKLRQLLEARGYRDVPRDDTRDCNFVLGDAQGHEVDIHSYTFDAEGNLIFGVAYPAEALTGTGSINGQTVKCISPERMVEFHTGYEVDEDDFRDVSALHQRFGIPIPDAYARWLSAYTT